jgi:hypothetical protein
MSSSNQLDQPNGGLQDERETSLLLGALQGLAVARKKEALLSKNTPAKKHNHTVSWDPNAGPPSIVKDHGEEGDTFDAMSQVTQPAPDDLESPPSSPKRSRWNKIVLKDVLGTNPLESEAESYIQRSLEEADPTRAGQSESQKSILSAVPDDAKHSFISESEARSERSAKSNETDPTDNTAYGYRASITTGEKLFGLAADLKRMQSQKGSGVASTFEATSQSDTFAHNAATILNRMKKKSADTGETAPTHKVETTAVGGGKSNWNKLRLSVVDAGADKKSDEEVVDSDGDGDGDVEAGNGNWNEETAGGEGENSAFQKMKRAKEQIKSDLSDFEDFLKFRKVNMISYVKVVLFFVILPATGIAALLFYAVDNPPCGVAKECLAEEIRKNVTLAELASQSVNVTEAEKEGQFTSILDRENVSQASVSWWLLFVFCRQVRVRIIEVAEKGVTAPFLTLARSIRTGHHINFRQDITSSHYLFLLSAIDSVDKNTWSLPDALHR